MIVGVDIGGSGVRAARVERGAITSEILRVDLQDRSVRAVVDAVASMSHELEASALGVGVPGFVHRGVVLGSPNFPAFKGVALAERLQRRTGLPIALGNDANVAALGAWADRGGIEDLILLTLGTGVGGGVVIGGRLLVGAGGTGAELGHIHVGGDRACGCGGAGCLEMWCGTVGLKAAALERGRAVLDGEEVIEAARAGEIWAVEVIQAAAEHLGKGLVSLVNVFNPDVVVIAGGLAQAGDLLAPAETWLRARAVPPSASRARLVWGGRADRWAILGAGALAVSIR